MQDYLAVDTEVLVHSEQVEPAVGRLEIAVEPTWWRSSLRERWSNSLDAHSVLSGYPLRGEQVFAELLPGGDRGLLVPNLEPGEPSSVALARDIP